MDSLSAVVPKYVVDTVCALMLSPSEKPSFVSTWLPAIVAIVVVLMGGFIQFHLTRRSFVSSNRMKWVEDLRKTFAEYVTMAFKFFNSDPKVMTSPDFFELKNRITQTLADIELRLNPSEESHEKLLESANRVLETMVLNKSIGSEKTAFLSSMSDLKGLMRGILKEEWEKAKRLN